MSRPPVMLTAEEVAQRLRTTPMAIIRACRRGDIWATKPHRHWLITEESLADYITRKSNKNKGKGAA